MRVLLPPLLLAEASQPATDHSSLSHTPSLPSNLTLAPAPCCDDAALVVSAPEKAHMPGSNRWVSETPTLQTHLRRNLYWSLKQGQGTGFEHCVMAIQTINCSHAPQPVIASTLADHPGHGLRDGMSQGLSPVNCMGEAKVQLYQHKPYHITPPRTTDWILARYTYWNRYSLGTNELQRGAFARNIIFSFVPLGLSPGRVCKSCTAPSMPRSRGEGCNIKT